MSYQGKRLRLSGNNAEKDTVAGIVLTSIALVAVIFTMNNL